jgi:DNA mismatch repair protein MutS
VARGIVRVVTAGTLTEEALLESRSANWLVALAPVGDEVGIAATDISTGRFETCQTPVHGVNAELARLGPSEIVSPEGAGFDGTQRPRSEFLAGDGERRLKAQFGVATLDGFGQFSKAELAACGGLLAYLDHVGKGALPFLAPPVRLEASDHMLIDAATRESLELVRASGGTRAGSLLDVIDRTVTGAGARLLAADISAPLMDVRAIEDRLDLVSWFADTGSAREAMRANLRALPDIGRALGRLAAGRSGPRDLGMLRDGLNEARMLRERLARGGDVPPLMAVLLPLLDGHGELVDLLARAIVSNPPLDAGQGGYIAEGYDAALDELRSMGGDGRRAMAMLEARYRDQTGISGLKIKHNNVLGYHIEVSAKNADPLMAAESGFTHRQTLAGVVRFNAPELHDLAIKVTQAGAHALAAEAGHLEELTGLALARAREIAATADALARFDVASALAERAIEGGWARPAFAPDARFEITGGRHPVVEAAVAKSGERFVANDCALVPNSRLWLVTGPNMGGKSTFLRQNALIAVMDAKYAYSLWRPVTAIRNGDIDGNDHTERDAAWTPMIETPLHPEYPCAHCILAATVATVLKAEARQRALPVLSTTSPTAQGAVRSWNSLDAFVQEVALARIVGGVHYRHSTEVGQAMGQRIGEWALHRSLAGAH